MIDILAALPQLPSLEEIIRWGGYFILIVIIFSETGLLIGFFLPGDSLLVTAGLFAARGDLDIVLLNLCLWAAAILGNSTGYLIGRKAGTALYNRPQSRLFRRDHLIKTREFYDKYGGVTIMISAFMPFARTFCPVVAGIAQMQYRKFIFFNIAGAIVWISSMTLVGYFLGRSIPGVEKHIEYIVLVVVAVSVSPLAYKYIRHRMKKRSATTNS
jgi:membrane-associated protein